MPGLHIGNTPAILPPLVAELLAPLVRLLGCEPFAGRTVMEELKQTDYTALVTEIKGRIRDAQHRALRAVNKELIDLYWNIGKLIVEKQQGATWGHSVVEKLAIDVRGDFPGVQGFSAANMWRMKLFYENYSGSQKLAQLVREIGWGHNVTIFEKCKNDLEREFYLRMAQAQGWSRSVLVHQIENQTYRKTMLNQTNFAATLPAESQARAMLAVKLRNHATNGTARVLVG